jgi:hypothetical protein
VNNGSAQYLADLKKYSIHSSMFLIRVFYKVR